jgi:hypothetical protein
MEGRECAGIVGKGGFRIVIARFNVHAPSARIIFTGTIFKLRSGVVVARACLGASHNGA